MKNSNIKTIMIIIAIILTIILAIIGCESETGNSSPEYGSQEYIDGLSDREQVEYWQHVYHSNH